MTGATRIRPGRIALAAAVTLVAAAAQKEAVAVDRTPEIAMQPGYVSGELVFPLPSQNNGRPTPACHASTIVETARGTLLAAWFGGTREGARDVGIWLSRREPEEETWSRPVEVATGEWTLGRRYPCWNPVLFQPREGGRGSDAGPLMLFFKVGPNPSEWWGELTSSRDDGRTWTARRALPRGGIGPVKNKPLQLPGGAILCPSSSEHDGWRVHFEITRDLGETWETTGPIHDGTKLPSIQPSILVHPDGRLQILCRTRGRGVVSQSWSADGGRTWSAMSATSLPNPNAGTDATTLTGGRHLIVYNPLKSGRHRLSVALSADGETWHDVLKLEDAESGEYSYPAVIQASDGLVHVTYTYRRRSIKHVVLDPEGLPGE